MESYDSCNSFHYSRIERQLSSEPHRTTTTTTATSSDKKYSSSFLMRRASLKIKERRTGVKEEVEVIADHNGRFAGDLIVHDGKVGNDDTSIKSKDNNATEKKSSSSPARIPGTVLKYMRKCEQQPKDVNCHSKNTAAEDTKAIKTTSTSKAKQIRVMFNNNKSKNVDIGVATKDSIQNEVPPSAPPGSRILRLSNRRISEGMNKKSSKAKCDNSSYASKRSVPASPPRAANNSVPVSPPTALNAVTAPAPVQKKQCAPKISAHSVAPVASKVAPTPKQKQHRAFKSSARAAPHGAPKAKAATASAPTQKEQPASKEVTYSSHKRDRARALARTRKERNEKTMIMKQEQLLLQ